MLNKKAMAAGNGVTPTDPDFEYVTMLLHGDGTNGAQNNTFIDGSTNNFTVTRNGNTTQGSLNPFGDRWSNYFDGNGDYLSVARNTAFIPTSNEDFTFEAWIYLTATPDATNGAQIAGLHETGTAADWTWFVNSSRQIGLYVQSSAGVYTNTTTAINLNSWNHVAVSRSGTASNNMKIFVNGVGQSFSFNGTFSGTGNYQLTIGADQDGNESVLTGYISNLRIVKGTAVYTANFTPPTAPLTAITNTSLLTCQSNRLIDNSSNNFTITRNGDVSVRPFSPFSPSAAYSTSTNGGSSYYGTTDSYLTLPDNANLRFGSSNFTFELWFYKVSNPGAATNIIGWNTNSNNSAFAALRLQLENANTVTLLMSESGSSWQVNATSSSTYVNNTWNHLAVVRNGATVTVYVNGVSFTSGSLSSSSASLFAGTVNNINDLFFNTNTWSMIGYISNARLVIGTAVYTANFTPPTAPLTAITNTSLLLNFTNGGIIDSAANNVLETVGNAQISTSVKKYGTGSLAFDGTGDWLLTPDSVDLRLGTGNFTIEFWLYLSATGAARGVVGKGASTTGWLVSTNSSNNVVFTYGTSTITSTGTLSGSTWYHIAVVRSGTGSNQTKIYIDGTNDGTGTVSTDFTQTEAMYVGANRTGGDALNGYIDDLRITKGVARYTANFTPPTAAFPDL